LPDGSSCYYNSCPNIVLCLHWNLVQKSLHVLKRKKSNGVKSRVRGRHVIYPHVQPFLCQSFHPNTH
jgi:hypothetical protein